MKSNFLHDRRVHTHRDVGPPAGRPIELRVELTPEAKLRLDELTERDGMKQKVALSRLVEWFTSQPDAIQAVVMGRFPPGMAPDVARLILKRLDGTHR